MHTHSSHTSLTHTHAHSPPGVQLSSSAAAKATAYRGRGGGGKGHLVQEEPLLNKMADQWMSTRDLMKVCTCIHAKCWPQRMSALVMRVVGLSTFVCCCLYCCIMLECKYKCVCVRARMCVCVCRACVCVCVVMFQRCCAIGMRSCPYYTVPLECLECETSEVPQWVILCVCADGHSPATRRE